jgi:hypothetical protein
MVDVDAPQPESLVTARFGVHDDGIRTNHRD